MFQISLDGRVAVVTGGGGGLGRQHALLLAARGASVVVNDISPAQDGGVRPADAVVREITEAGGRAAANYDSVTTEAGGQAVVATALDAFGQIDVVINNAGILRDRAFHNLSAVEDEQVIAVHVLGAINVTRPAWRLMRAQGYGRIVNTSSAAGLFGNFGQTNYAAAKMGLVGLTRALAIEGRKFGINANAIAPIALTQMTEGLMREDVGARLKASSVAPVVTWLASEACDVNGSVFTVAGGHVAEVFVGVTPGVTFDGDVAPEDIQERLDSIREREGYYVPQSSTDEMHAVLAAFGDGAD